MKAYLETVIVITGCGSAIFWLISAMSRFPTVKPGGGEIDRSELSKVLRRMNRWNFFAARLMGVTALLEEALAFASRVPLSL